MNRFALTLLFLLICGCMARVTVDKRPCQALPIYDIGCTNGFPKEYVIVDQGYEVRYVKWGFNTEIKDMSAEIRTNRTVSFNLGGLQS